MSTTSPATIIDHPSRATARSDSSHTVLDDLADGSSSHAPDPASIAEEVVESVVALAVAAGAAAKDEDQNRNGDTTGLVSGGTTTQRWDSMQGSVPESDDHLSAVSNTWVDAPEPESEGVPYDLRDASIRQLRRWSNQLFTALDTDFPSYEVLDDFERVAAEIERREESQTAAARPAGFREKMRDNTTARRFELFRNGELAGYLAYTLREGTLRLHPITITTTSMETFAPGDVEGSLIRLVLLTAHKRRLAVIPYCQHAQDFLRHNPHYQQLLHP